MKKLLSLLLVLLFFISLSAPSVTFAAATKLDKSKLTLNVGRTYTLKLTGASGKVTWSSSNKDIATVSTKGKVKAVAVGKATITATNRGKKYKCTVTIKEPVAEIILAALIFDGTSIEDYCKSYENDYLDYIDVKPYDDEHIVITMKEADRLDAIKMVNEEFDKNLSEFISDEAYEGIFTKIEADKLFKKITIYANKEKYVNSFAGISIILTAAVVSDTVQALNLIDMDDRECTITVIDASTGEILYTAK